MGWVGVEGLGTRSDGMPSKGTRQHERMPTAFLPSFACPPADWHGTCDGSTVRRAVLGNPVGQKHAVAAAGRAAAGRCCSRATVGATRAAALQAPLPVPIAVGVPRSSGNGGLLHVLPPLVLGRWPPWVHLWRSSRFPGLLLLLLPLLLPLLLRVVFIEHVQRSGSADVPQP